MPISLLQRSHPVPYDNNNHFIIHILYDRTVNDSLIYCYGFALQVCRFYLYHCTVVSCLSGSQLDPLFAFIFRNYCLNMNLHLLHASLSVIWIGLFLLPVVCWWCGYPIFTAVGPFLFDPGCPGGPLSAPDPGGGVDPLPVLFGPLLGDPGRPWYL